MKKISVMIVDDHPLFRQGLRHVLDAEEDMEVVAEATDGEEALQLAREKAPDVVLMDISLPTLNGLQVTRQIKAHLPHTAVIVLTAYHSDEQVFHALRAGASAYYPKDVTAKKLIRAIREVSKGNYIVDDRVMAQPQVASWLLQQFEQVAGATGSMRELFLPLSPREMEILRYIVRGYSNKEIARALGISQQTVKNHLSSILRKLAVNDRTQAAIYALRCGWIRLQDIKE